jgi:thiol-disulfide isomerase/thioredoxin
MKWRFPVWVLAAGLVLGGCGLGGDNDFDEKPLTSAPRVAIVSWKQGVEVFYNYLQKQRKGGRGFIAYFYSSYCPFCKDLENRYLRQHAFMKTFWWYPKVLIGVNYTVSEKAVWREMGLKKTPALLVFPPGGGRPVVISQFMSRYGTHYRKKLPAFVAEVRRALRVPGSYRP